MHRIARVCLCSLVVLGVGGVPAGAFAPLPSHGVDQQPFVASATSFAWENRLGSLLQRSTDATWMAGRGALGDPWLTEPLDPWLRGPHHLWLTGRQLRPTEPFAPRTTELLAPSPASRGEYASVDLGLAALDPESDGPSEEAKPGPRLLTDVMVVAAATATHSLAYPKVRERLRDRASWDMVWQNLKSPIRRAKEGGSGDVDPFVTNYVVHPLSWGMLGLYLKERGYSDVSALAFSQAHSFAWEYIIEGSYQKPSSKDLLTNAVSSAVAIYWLHDLSERAAGKEQKRAYHHVLAALNPLRPFRGVIAPGGNEERARVEPLAGPTGVGIRVAITW